MNPLSACNSPEKSASEARYFQHICYLFVVIFQLGLKQLAGFIDSFFSIRVFRYGYCIAVFTMLAFIGSAQISSTATGGNWNATATWVGGIVPGAASAVTIVSGATVTVNINNAKCLSVRIGGGANTTAILSFNGGSLLTVSGDLIMGSNGQRKGSINMANGGTLQIGGALTTPNLNTFTSGTGTIEYNGSGAQTVGALGIYNNLIFSGSGVKSIVAGTSVAGKLSITGATASIGNGLNINVGRLTLGGLNKANGTWGASTSAATNKDNGYFAATTGILTVTIDGRILPAFSGLAASPAITYGTSTVTLSGVVGGSGPAYPVNGETVSITINGTTQNAIISGSAGAFSVNFPTATLNATAAPYTIQYAYAGNAALSPVTNGLTSLKVNPAALTITANNQSKNYGTTFIFTGTAFSTTGSLYNGNTVTGVTLTSSGATATAPVAGSPYLIVPSAATGVGLSNYSITYSTGILTVNGISESIADFRSKTNGNFSSVGSWEFDRGGNSWINATQIPANNNNISIGHDITLNQNYTTGAGKTLLINTGGTLTINPGNVLDVAATGTLNFNARPVTIKSTKAGTGSIGKILGILTGASNVTVERFLEANKRAWRFLTIPVTGTTIRQAWAGVAANAAAPTGETGGIGTLMTGHNYTVGSTAAAAGFDWFAGLGSTTTSSIRFYSIATAWASATNTPNPLALPNKEGYFLYVRGDRTIASNSGFGTTTLRPAGTLKQGPQTVAVNELYTVVGNPYACAINLDDMYSNLGNSAVIERNFWVWDATLGTSGGYRALSWNGFDEYDMTGGGGLAADYLVVNSGQAFFVKQQAAGNISIQENNKTIATTPKLLRPVGIAGAGVSSLNIRLYQATGSTIGLQSDMVTARYNDVYSESATEIYDAAKLNNFNENLSLVRDNRYLSIESRPFSSQTDTLYLPFWGLSKRDYALTFTANKFAGISQMARLTDAFTNTAILVNLNDSTTTYPFTVTSDPASSSLDRFKIIMIPITVLPVRFTKINAAVAGTKVQVSWATGSELGLKNYTVERSADGTNFSKIGEVAAMDAANGFSYQFTDLFPLVSGSFYRIRSNDKSGKNAYSNIVQVKLSSQKGMQAMPTAISDKHFTLLLSDQPAGKYRLQLTNAAGLEVFQKMVINNGGNNEQVIDLGSRVLAPGVYNLTIVKPDGSYQNFSLLINR